MTLHLSTALAPLFAPQSVAIIGASRTPGKLGHTVLRNLVRGGFTGAMAAINPGGEAVEGQPGYRAIGEVPGPVDCAFLAIPAPGIVDAVRACAAAGVRSVIVGAAGFAELGTPEGRARQSEIAALARAAGMRVLGPNTNGILALNHHLYLGYNASHGERFAPGPVSIISHSGALFDGVARRLRDAGTGLSYFVPVGNEADVTMLEVFAALIDDPATRVIGLVIEGLADDIAFLAACSAAHAAGKHVVALKIGRSQRGASAALAHSSRLAGSARAYDALFRAGGVASVTTVEALAGTCALLARCPRPTTAAALPAANADAARLVCVTTSGAGGAILADYASNVGLELAGDAYGKWPAAAQAAIDALPTSAPINNPIDTGSLGDWSLLEPTFTAIEAVGCTGPTVVYAHIAATAKMAADLSAALLGRRARCAAPLAVLAPGGLGAAAETTYIEAGIPVFRDTAACFESLAAALPRTPEVTAGQRAPLATDDVAGQLLTAANGHVLSELESARVLAAAGVPLVESVVVHDAASAQAAAARLGYPVVLKALVPGIAHKNHHGLVATRLADAAAVAREFAAMTTRAALAAGDAAAATRTTWLVQPMASAEVELIIGVSHEPGLGHFLVFGAGGIHAELFDAVDLVHVATPPALVRAHVQEAHVGRLLSAIDRTAPGGLSLIDQVTTVLLALQGLIADHGPRIDSIDINPLLVGNRHCLAVDALIVPR